MSFKFPALLFASLLILSGCAQNDTADYTAPEKGDAEFYKGKETRADELYINTQSPNGGRDYRDVYIAPANLSSMQVIQPEGVSSDDGWQVTEAEEAKLQKTIVSEFSSALVAGSAFNLVDDAQQAQIILYTTVVAIHPNSSKAEVEAGAKGGGAITVSLALVDAGSKEVLVRSVDTKSTDDIWAFHEVGNSEPAINLIFRSWGNSVRRGILHLQGRSSDPLAAPLILKPQ